MQYVRALVNDQWREVPVKVAPPAEPDPHAPEPPKLVRTLVRCEEVGKWCVNNAEFGVDVSPGLVLGFNRAEDAEFFLLSEKKRASRVQVSKGDIVTFWNDEDAQHFIDIGQAEKVGRRVAERELAAKAPTTVVAMRSARQA
jgi:hypothetical protein